MCITVHVGEVGSRTEQDRHKPQRPYYWTMKTPLLAQRTSGTPHLATLSLCQGRALCRCYCGCMQDTFLDAGHLKGSFPGSEVHLQQGLQQAQPQRPFKVTFAQPPPQPQADGKVCLLALLLPLNPSRGVGSVTPSGGKKVATWHCMAGPGLTGS